MTSTSTTSELRDALGENVHHARHNYLRGILAGLFAGLGRNFIHPELIIVGVVAAMTDNNPYWIALVPIVNKFGILGPQLLASSFFEHTPRRRPWFVGMTFIRVALLLSMVGSLWLLGRDVRPALLVLFLLTYTLASASAGTSHILFMDMVGRLVVPHRVGAFLATRRLLGGVLGIAAGLVLIQPVLNGFAVPDSYVLLLAIGAGLVAIDMGIWCTAREEPGARARRRTSFRESLARGFGWLRRDHNYRCFLLLRLAFRVNYLGLAFFIPYGRERLTGEDPAGVAVLGGILVATMKTAQVASTVLWGRLVDRRGPRAVLLLGGLMWVVAPALALLAPMLPAGDGIALPLTDRPLDLPLGVYLLALAAIGCGLQATGIGGQKFFISHAPPHRRASYIGFLNFITLPMTLLPLAGAWLADLAGIPTLFALLIGGGALFAFGASLMKPDATTVPAGD